MVTFNFKYFQLLTLSTLNTLNTLSTLNTFNFKTTNKNEQTSNIIYRTMGRPSL